MTILKHGNFQFPRLAYASDQNGHTYFYFSLASLYFEQTIFQSSWD